MTTELQLQEGLQTCIRTLPPFSTADVVINDRSLLDGSSMNAPYVIIENSDTLNLAQRVKTPQPVYQIPVTLLERFLDWVTTPNNFRDHRQTITDAFNNADGNFRTAGGLQGVKIDRIFNLTPIGPVFDSDIDPRLRPDAMPLFWGQTLIFECTCF